jgi:hypothetical protein
MDLCPAPILLPPYFHISLLAHSRATDDREVETGCQGVAGLGVADSGLTWNRQSKAMWLSGNRFPTRTEARRQRSAGISARVKRIGRLVLPVNSGAGIRKREVDGTPTAMRVCVRKSREVLLPFLRLLQLFQFLLPDWIAVVFSRELPFSHLVDVFSHRHFGQYQ